jgi:hypothetical protein
MSKSVDAGICSCDEFAAEGCQETRPKLALQTCPEGAALRTSSPLLVVRSACSRAFRTALDTSNGLPINRARGLSSLLSTIRRRCRGARVDRPYNLGMAPYDENSGQSAAGRCQLCGRLLGEDRLTRHHLLPRSRSRKMKRRRKGRQELKRRDPGRTVALCGLCHRNVHVSIGNTDLARGYDSVEALRDHPGVRRFTEWVKDKPHGRA